MIGARNDKNAQAITPSTPKLITQAAATIKTGPLPGSGPASASASLRRAACTSRSISPDGTKLTVAGACAAGAIISATTAAGGATSSAMATTTGASEAAPGTKSLAHLAQRSLRPAAITASGTS